MYNVVTTNDKCDRLAKSAKKVNETPEMVNCAIIIRQALLINGCLTAAP
jgi:hypothetical protein